MDLPEIGEDALDVVERMGPFGMARELYAPPGVGLGLGAGRQLFGEWYAARVRCHVSPSYRTSAPPEWFESIQSGRTPRLSSGPSRPKLKIGIEWVFPASPKFNQGGKVKCVIIR